jgi:4-hydroxybenzoate polyprenyltransferase
MTVPLGMLGDDAAMLASALFIVATLASLAYAAIQDHQERARRA